MAYLHADDTTDGATPTHVTLTTDHATAGDVGPFADALHAAGVAVERHTFLPTREDMAHPWGVLLLAVDGPPVPLARLVAPATAPIDVFSALAAALGIGHRPTPATLQLKADGMFISVRARDRLDITSTLMGLLAQLAHLHPGSPRAMERRLVYGEGTWRIDP